ncbi:hypothetical protein F4777DRAFT_593335 [Nemania sp. FL0916]|nr:hypothetical protein F4777DRAFT_593335 [Nemania sp. FL0916]
MSDSLRLLWSALPAELRLIILNNLAEEPAEHKYQRSAYTVVCKEWQHFFEPVLFRRLILHQSDVKKMGEIVRDDRIAYVKWVWLRFELPPYDCTHCEEHGFPEENQRYNQLFTNAVWELFAILRSWGPRGRGGGITLELSAHSPSDALHHYKPLQRRIHDTAWAWKQNRPGEGQRYHDPKHGWESTRRTIPQRGALERLFVPWDGLKFDRRASFARKLKRLPRVTIINTIYIRRQFLRRFSAAFALSTIFQSTPAVTDFRYEPWFEPCFMSYQDYNFLLSDVFKRAKHLKRISIYESCSGFLHEMHRHHPSSVLGRALEQSSFDLEGLHIGKVLDSRDFFYRFWPCDETGYEIQSNRRERKWEQLRSLSFSSVYLNPLGIDNLMSAASSAAMMMPRLEIMELWIGITGNMCIFRYRRRADSIKIELLSTRHARITSRMEKQWARVAEYHNSRVNMEVENIDVDPGQIKGEACILQYLVCQHMLLNEVSLLQIQEEFQELASYPSQ